MSIRTESAERVASTWRVASEFWNRLSRSVPMYTDDALRTLGLSSGASPEEIKSAYRKMMMLHHPDRGGDTAKAQQINEAYAQLKEGITINRPYGYSRPTPTPPPRPAPPRPTPTPPPRPTPSANPHIRVTWRMAENLTGMHGESRPDAKDIKRIDDMIVRAKGNPAKLAALAQQMASSIDSIAKALRRGRAAEEHADSSVNYASQVFYTRARTLAGV